MKKINILLASIAVIIAAVLMMIGTGSMQSMQAAFLSAVSPFLKTGSAVQKGLGEMGKGLKTLEQLDAENQQLTTENKELRATNQILRDIELENEKLRAALDYRERSLFRIVAAQVVGRDASTWWSTITINRGFEDGVEPEMTVITDLGLVGKTMTVSKNEAIVMLASDENCKVGAYVEGTLGGTGIVNGVRVQAATGSRLEMNFLSKTADLKPEQKVYSKGVGAVFPAGLLIGTVESFRQRELDGQAILTPAVDFATLSAVFVIVGVR